MNVVTPVLHQGVADRQAVGTLDVRHALLEFHDPANLLSAGVVMSQGDDGPVVADQRIVDMPVRPAGLRVLHDEPGRILEAELPLVSIEEGVTDLRPIPADRWIDVKVMHRTLGPAVSGRRDQVIKAFWNRLGIEPTHMNQIGHLADLVRKVPRECPAALTAGRTGDHFSSPGRGPSVPSSGTGDRRAPARRPGEAAYLRPPEASP